MDLGILIARLIVGLAIASHGAQKLFGWFGGYGLDATGCYFEDIGFRPGALFALASGACEMVGGILTAIGLLGPVGPGLIVLAMLVAILAVHRPNGFFATNDGIELPLMYLTASLTIAFSGVGTYSVDALLGVDVWPQPWASWISVGVAVLLALATLAARRHAPRVQSHA
jgi:putative oxidoreductase